MKKLFKDLKKGDIVLEVGERFTVEATTFDIPGHVRVFYTEQRPAFYLTTAVAEVI